MMRRGDELNIVLEWHWTMSHALSVLGDPHKATISWINWYKYHKSQEKSAQCFILFNMACQKGVLFWIRLSKSPAAHLVTFFYGRGKRRIFYWLFITLSPHQTKNSSLVSTRQNSEKSEMPPLWPTLGLTPISFISVCTNCHAYLRSRHSVICKPHFVFCQITLHRITAVAWRSTQRLRNVNLISTYEYLFGEREPPMTVLTEMLHAPNSGCLVVSYLFNKSRFEVKKEIDKNPTLLGGNAILRKIIKNVTGFFCIKYFWPIHCLWLLGWFNSNKLTLKPFLTTEYWLFFLVLLYDYSIVPNAASKSVVDM